MKFAALAPLNSAAVFHIYWAFWRLTGVTVSFPKGSYKRYLYNLYDVLLNVFITIWYPTHLVIGLFLEKSQANVFKNLAIVITCVICSIKHYINRWQLPNVRRVERLLRQLDARALASDERAYFNTGPQVTARRVLLIFSAFYTVDLFAPSIDTLLSQEQRLVYPAWLPFDWHGNIFSYYAAVFYQIVGVGVQLLQNLINDYYGPAILCIICGQLHMLSMRVSRIGECVEKTTAENNAELIACVEDHKKLLTILALVQEIFQYTQLLQFLSSGLNICLTIVFMLLYVDTIFGYIYYTFYFISISIELLPVCYYGSKLQQELQQLPYAIFRSNWSAQTKDFQQNQRIFTSLALRNFTPSAGGVIDIHLNAFISTCKMAYSLYTVVMQMK